MVKEKDWFYSESDVKINLNLLNNGSVLCLISSNRQIVTKLTFAGPQKSLMRINHL